MYLIILYICSVCQVFVKQKAPIHPPTNTSFGWGVLDRSDKKQCQQMLAEQTAAESPLIHVKDLSQAIYVAGLKKEAAAQTFNLTDGFTHSW